MNTELRSDLRSSLVLPWSGQPSCDDGHGENATMRHFMDALPDAAWIQDTYTGEIVFVNAAYERVWGQPAETLYRDPPSFLDAVHPDDRHTLSLVFPGYAGFAVSGEFRVLHADGEIVWLACRTLSIDDRSGNVARVMVIAEDITARKVSEAAMRERLQNLESRCADMDAFAHTVAHNLRNPLNLILGNAQLLLRTLSTCPLADEDVESLLDIVSMVEKANTIIENLLLLSAAGTCGVTCEVLAMEDIVASALDRLGSLVDRTAARITLPEVWPPALGHAPWVEEVWVNYLDNALKYGGPQPSIELGAEGLDGEKVRFFICDHGPGIAEADLARVYKPFTRLSPSTTDGNGLGLAIVSRIIEQLDGEVAVQSAPGEGSTFSFTLPAARDSEGACEG